MKRLGIIYDRILDITVWISGFILVAITVLVVLGVVLRYFGFDLTWVVEISEYSLLYITFLIAAWVLKEKRHVSMDFVSQHLKPGPLSLLFLITSMVSAVVLIIITVTSIMLTMKLYEYDYRTPTILEVPKYLIVGIIPIGTFLLLIELLRQADGYWRRWRRGNQ
jgi:C4-dicarboxylate transporter DctQ subunit